MIAVRPWEDKWVEPDKRDILLIKDSKLGEPLADVKVHDAKGNLVDLDGITVDFPSDITGMTPV